MGLGVLFNRCSFGSTETMDLLDEGKISEARNERKDARHGSILSLVVYHSQLLTMTSSLLNLQETTAARICVERGETCVTYPTRRLARLMDLCSLPVGRRI
jgi:hypothetical protein